MAVKTTVYLDPDDYRRLKLVARRDGRTAAALLREAVAEFSRRRAALPKAKSLGAGRSRKGDLSQRAEQLLKGLGRPR